jgi:putative spermidine/putrescine transport system substrate-binding protein
MAGQRQSIKRRDFLRAAGAGLAVGPFVHVRPAKADKGELVVVSWGGPWNEALRNVMFKDFEAETGIRVRDDAPPENAKIKAMVESGNVTWDVIDTDMPAILTLVDDDLLEPIDYAKLDQAKLAKIPSELHHPYAIGHKIYSFNICYNTDIFPKGQHPKTWADVWDGENFPGGRTFNFRGGVSPQLEVALLADGVPMDQLYPLDVERGWRSFDRLRPLVTKWYGSHSEAIQLLSNGEVAVGCTIGAETITAKRQGAPVDVEYNQGKLSSDYWSIVKGTHNPEAAHQFIDFALAGDRQAGMSKYVPYGFSNSDAANYLTPEEAADLCSSPENLKKQFWWNVEWWGAVGEDGKTPRERLAEEYAAWMVKG